MRLIDSLTPVASYTLFLERRHLEVNPPHETVAADYERMLTKSQTAAEEGGFSEDDFDLARFAVCAWVDEVIMLSDWEGAEEWGRGTLQRRFYDTANAGEEFFERLNGLEDENSSVREVFAACLALGFKGQYFSDDQQEGLEQIKTSQFELLWSEAPEFEDEADDVYFPEAYPAERTVKRQSRGWLRAHPFSILLFIIPPVVLISLFAVYRFYLYKLIYEYFQKLL